MLRLVISHYYYLHEFYSINFKGVKNMEQNKKMLVAGASFAGLTTAYWMNKNGL
ncbi:protein of unknown function [Chryseobacterium sp. JV274]|nr:protein of unknown function [Chryseobacterium sp. JV274]